MKHNIKGILFKCLRGAAIGLAASMVITIIISLIIGDGNFYFVTPELAAECGSELSAVIVVTLLSFLYGAAWGGAAAIWEKEGWSLTRQTLVHLAVTSLSSLPIAYVARWMSRDLKGVLMYAGAFFAVYLIIWLIQYSALKKRVKEMNGGLKSE